MKATRDDYRKRSLAELADEAFLILKASQHNLPMSAARVGEQLFSAAVHRGTAPFARIAGRVLRLLERQGRAVWIVDGDTTGWRPFG